MPLVGALIGAVAGAAMIASALIFPEPLPVVIGLATAIAVTGALHETASPTRSMLSAAGKPASVVSKS